MEYIEQLLQSIGEGSQLTIYIKDDELFGFVHEEIGHAHFEVLSWREPVHQFKTLIARLNDQAEEWLSENS